MRGQREREFPNTKVINYLFHSVALNGCEVMGRGCGDWANQRRDKVALKVIKQMD